MTEGRNILNEQQNQVALDNQASQKLSIMLLNP